MKPQTTKKLFAFTIMMMFSISFLHAQCAPDEVLMSKGGGKTRCTEKCVKLNQEDLSLRKGWAPFGCPHSFPGIAPGSDAIPFILSQSAKASINIYDMEGRLIKILADNEMLQGNHQIEWNAKNENGNAVSAGTYFFRLDAGNNSQTKKLLVIK